MGKTYGFIYNEHNGDNLFRYEGKRLIGQFIGSDFREGCDCNYYFERRYGISGKAGKHYWRGRGYVFFTHQKICHLVVMRNSDDKPALNNIEEALIELRDIMIKRGFKQVVLPRIEGVEWQKVHDLIFKVFGGTTLDVLVVYNQEEYLFEMPPDTELLNWKHGDAMNGETERKYY